MNALAIFSNKDWLRLISDCILAFRKKSMDQLAHKLTSSCPFKQATSKDSGKNGGEGEGGEEGGGIGGVGGVGVRVDSTYGGGVRVELRGGRRGREERVGSVSSTCLPDSDDDDEEDEGDMYIGGESDGIESEGDTNSISSSSTTDQDTDYRYLSRSRSRTDSTTENQNMNNNQNPNQSGDCTDRIRMYSISNVRARTARSFKRRARERRRRDRYLAEESEKAEIELTKFTEPLLSLAHTLILRDMRAPPSNTRWVDLLY